MMAKTTAAAMRVAGDDQRPIPRKLNFTQTTLAALTCPAGKRRGWVYDTKVGGLALMMTDKGAKSYFLYRWFAGRPHQKRLGAFGEITVEQARRLVRSMVGDIADGVDPLEQARQAKQAKSFGDGFTKYMEQHAKVHKRTWEEDQQKYDRDLKAWKSRDLSSITVDDVRTMHQRIGKTSPGAANRTLALVRKVFNFLCVTPNPARGITRFPEHERSRFLKPTEIPVFLAALSKLDANWRDYFLLCLHTGARRGNLLSMEWSELDLDGKTWRIAPTKFKSGDKTGQPQTVPLVAEAVAILRKRLEAQQTQRQKDISDGKVGVDAPACRWVFPSTWSSSGENHLQEPKKAWEIIRSTPGLSDLRIHDLRRSAASFMAMAGANLPSISRALGHASMSTTAKVYALVNQDTTAQAMAAGVGAMMKAAQTGTGDAAGEPK